MPEDYQEFVDGAADAPGLRELAELVQQLAVAEAELSKVEEQQKAAQGVVRNLAEEQIPDLMRELGVASFQTTNGYTVAVGDVLAVSPRKDDKPKVWDWMEEHGAGGAVKRTAIVLVGKDADGKVEKLRTLAEELGLQFKEERKVEASTLKKFVRTWLEEQKREAESGAEQPRDPLPKKLFGVFEGQRAKITKKPDNPFGE